MNIDAHQLLTRLGIRYRTSAGKLLAICPNPEHRDTKPSWAFFTSGRFENHHKCLSCGFSGGVNVLVRTVLGCSQQEAYAWLQDPTLIAPMPLTIDVEVKESAPVLTHPEGLAFGGFDDWPTVMRAYLSARGLVEYHVTRWGIGYATQEAHRDLAGRVYLPLYDVDRRLVGWTARKVYGGGPKYMSASVKDGARQGALFGEQFWEERMEEGVLVLVEGPFDAIVADAVTGYAVGALRGSDLNPDNVRRLARWTQILVATDPDEAGERVWSALLGFSRHLDLRRIRLPKKTDVAEFALHHPDEFRELLAVGTKGRI